MAQALVDRASNVSDATLQKHIRAVSGFKETLETANAEYRASLKAAKKEGVNTGELIKAMAAKKRELEDVGRDLKQYVRYLGLMNMPVRQLDLFGADQADPSASDASDEDDIDAETEQRIWEANGAGQTAGSDGKPMTANPHEAGMLREAWQQGWMKSQAALAPKNGVKKASTRRSRTAAPLN